MYISIYVQTFLLPPAMHAGNVLATANGVENETQTQIEAANRCVSLCASVYLCIILVIALILVTHFVSI